MGAMELGIVLLTFVSVLMLGGAIVTQRFSQRQKLQARLRGEQYQAESSGSAGTTGAIVETVEKVGSMVASDKPSNTLRMQMVRAGLQGKEAVAIYLGSKIFLLVGGLVAGVFGVAFFEIMFLLKAAIVVMVSVIAFFIPNMFISFRCSQRTRTVRSHLPDMVDLLEICVSGGMGLDQAWNAVSNEIRAVCPLLADEMALTSLEMHLGEERGGAIRHMAERTGAEDLGSLVAVLIQSERFGTSIGEALRTFAETMREERSAKAEEAAEQMSVKMLFPMVVFIFPVVLIVAVGPAGIKLVDILGN